MRVVVTLPDGDERTHEGRSLGMRAEGSELRIVELDHGMIVATLASYSTGKWTRAKLHRDKFKPKTLKLIHKETLWQPRPGQRT